MLLRAIRGMCLGRQVLYCHTSFFNISQCGERYVCHEIMFQWMEVMTQNLAKIKCQCLKIDRICSEINISCWEGAVTSQTAPSYACVNIAISSVTLYFITKLHFRLLEQPVAYSIQTRRYTCELLNHYLIGLIELHDRLSLHVL